MKNTTPKIYDWQEELKKTVEAAAECSDSLKEFVAFMEACGYAVEFFPELHYITPGKTCCDNADLPLSDYAKYKLEKIFGFRLGGK